MSNSTEIRRSRKPSGPIFVLGLRQRTGTNFLRDLLVQHPACGGTEILAEDYLVHHAELLEQYCGWVPRHWAFREYPEDVERRAGELFRALGATLADFAGREIDAERPVLKSPSVRNVHLFFDLFENAALLVLVRDGRSVVESGMRSFDWDFETAVRDWVAAADVVIAFRRQMGDRPLPWALVRYEDLVKDLRPELTSALVAVGLDPDDYDFEAAGALPVKGSSTFRGGEGDVHWAPVDRTSEFRPLERWTNWPRSLHERFNWLAAEQLRALGYEPSVAADGALGWRVWNQWRDVWWMARRLYGKVRRRLGRIVGLGS